MDQTVRQIAWVWTRIAIWVVPASTLLDTQPGWAQLSLVLVAGVLGCLFSYLVFYRAVQIEEGSSRG